MGALRAGMVSPDDPGEARPLQANLVVVVFFTTIFFFQYMGRMVWGPLMVVVKEELTLDHAAAGGLFLYIAAGVCSSQLAAGLVSARMGHRRTVALSTIALGGVLVAAATSGSLWSLRLSLLALGLSAGLYFPSGMTSITAAVRRADWGKAIAIHELAPNLAFTAAPLISEILCRLVSWRGVVGLLGGITVAVGVAFWLRGRGGDFFGEFPRPSLLVALARRRILWVFWALFSLTIGANIGCYNMIPLYLVSERGLERSWANGLLAAGSLLTIGTVLVAGWAADKVGVLRFMVFTLVAAGVATAVIGLAPASLLPAAVIVQPSLAIGFYPAGLAALSGFFADRDRHLAIGLIIPLAILAGTGGVPYLLGHLGNKGLFSLGFVITGSAMVASVGLLPLVRAQSEPEQK